MEPNETQPEQQIPETEQASIPDSSELAASPDAREAVQAVIVDEQHKLLARFAILLFMCILLVSMLYIARPTDDFIYDGLVKRESAATEEVSPYFLPLEPFPTVELTAQAAYVYDLNTGQQIFSKNAEAQLPLASITKLMTVLVAHEVFGETGIVPMGTVSIADTGTSTASLIPSEQWLPKDIFTYTLVQSSNEAASAIASAAGAFAYSDNDYTVARERFINLMNEKAIELGLTQTYFLNETGLDETTGTGGSYGSAKDMAILMGELLRTAPETLEGTRQPATALSTIDHQQFVAINTNTELGNMPGLIASKTGFTDLAGGNLIVVFDPGIGRPVVISVLGSTVSGRFDDVRTLLHATLRYFGNESKPVTL